MLVVLVVAFLRVDLFPEGASLGEPGLPPRGLAQYGGAGSAEHDGLRVREDGGDGEASGAFDVHEE